MVIQTTKHPQVEEAERLGDEIAELSAHIEVASARLLDLIGQFDAIGGWGNGFKSCAEWLSWRVGLDLNAAGERVRVARALPGLHRIRQAFSRGQLSYSKVRALTRVATPDTEERLLIASKSMTAAQLERLVRAWQRVDRNAENQETAKRQRSRALYVYQDEDGMFVVRGRLTTEAGAALRQALAAACDRLYANARVNDPEGDPPTMGQQPADALGMIAEAALAHDLDPGAPGQRYQVVVHVDAPVLADPDQPGQSALEDGDHLSAESCHRLACDASRVIMRHDANGRVVEVGARTRTIPSALRRALNHRDRGCRFPGCRLRFTHGHHIQHWAEGGPTKLSNLVLLCRRHHRSVHEDGFHVTRLADGELEFQRPDGRVLPNAPALPRVPADGGKTLSDGNTTNGVEVDARTLLPAWTGERLDIRYAIDVLHPRAIGY
jgi:Domain of unknown function (DUF222)/HNH endonuclease